MPGRGCAGDAKSKRRRATSTPVDGIAAPARLLAGLVALVVLAGCADPGADAGSGKAAYGCDRCLLPADDDPTRGHFENFLAVSPSDDRHLVVAACTFDGERFQTTAHATFDQGRTWSVAELPYGPRVDPTHPLATVNFAADPGVAISPDGQTVVVSAVGLSSVPAAALRGNVPYQSVMFTARSDDGGRTFPPENVHVFEGSVQAYPAVQDFSDHPRIVAGADGTFLVMWGSLDLPSPLHAQRFLATQDVVLATSLEVRFSSSSDGGRTWSAPAIAYRDTDFHYYPPSPVILADGSWAVVPNQYNGGEGKVFFSSSGDQGRTWSWEETPMRVSGFGTPAVDPASGRLYYSYNEPAGESLQVVRPMLAVADGPGAPWTVHALTDGPTTRRAGIENMVAVDGRGVPHVLYVWFPEGAAAGELRVASLDPERGLLNTTLEAGIGADRVFGHYMGLAPLAAGGAMATWPRAEEQSEAIWRTDAPLLAGVVEWS